MQVLEYLKKSGVKYEPREHKPTFSAQQMAAVEHEPGKFVAKPVVVKADGKYMMCVLAACCKVDLGTLNEFLSSATAASVSCLSFLNCAESLFTSLPISA